ncbi:MAG: EamA family transporter [Alphaproteobacteria bacterium PA4]|nr:MAG: EamA family transporter [Alphaproteobacteria bacterium PA4]
MPATATAGRLGARVWISFAIITLIWGSTWLVIKTQLGVVPPSWSVTWRFLVGGTAMLLMCLATGKSLRLTARQHGFALIVAVMQFVLNFNLVYRAEQHVTSGLVALSFALLLVPNAVLAALFLGQRITLRFALGSALGIIGVLLLFARDLLLPGADDREILTGLGLAFAGVFSASIANVMQASPAGRAMPLEGGLAWSMLYGAALNAGVALVLAGPPVIDPSPAYLAGVAYLGLVASALAFSLYYAIIRAIGPGPAAYSGVVIPIVAMALSTLFEAYVWSPLALLGCGLALAGLVVALRSRR